MFQFLGLQPQEKGRIDGHEQPDEGAHDAHSLARNVVGYAFIAQDEEQDAGHKESQIKLLLRSYPLPYRLYKAVEKVQDKDRYHPQDNERQEIKKQPVKLGLVGLLIVAGNNTLQTAD